MKRVLIVLVLACLLAGYGAGAARAAESPTTLAGWEFKDLGPVFSAPLLEGGRLIWFPFGGYPPTGARLYDVASGTTRTLPVGVSLENADLQGDHLAYVTSDGMNSSKLCLLTLSTDQTVTIQQSSYIGGPPQIRGDLVLWNQSALGSDGRLATSIYAYTMSTGRTRVLVDSSITGSDPWEFWAGDRWVVFNGGYDPMAQSSSYWSLELSTGHAHDLGGLWPQAIQGDDLFYLPSPYTHTELHRLNLATGVDTLIAKGTEFQNVRVDGDRLVWAYWEDYVAYVVLYDLTTGTRVRIPVPSYGIGGLQLKGDLIIWHGEASGAIQNSQGHNYLFAYDVSRGTVTRLGRVYRYPVQWATDGSSVAFPRFGGFSAPQLMTIAAPTALPAVEFADLSGTDPYRTAVLGLRDAGVVLGYPREGGGADFRPGASLTRAQFAKMLAIALQVPVSEGAVAPFSDLGPDDPASLFPHDYIAALAELGILQGTSPGHFSPNTTLTRAQMVTLVVRALEKLHPLSLAGPPQYWDGPTLGPFDPTHGTTMATAEWSCLLDGLVGFGSLWNPWALATRAEAAQVLWNAPSTQQVPQAKATLAAALDISSERISAYPDIPSSVGSIDSLLKWPGGQAGLDTGGRIAIVMQDAPPAAPSDTYLTTGELEVAADAALAQLGWDAAALAGEGFVAEPSSVTDQTGNHEFVRSWVGHTGQGIDNSGLIRLRLDARDGRLVLFEYHRGVGNYPADLSSAIGRDEAIAIARARVVKQYPDATIALESATLKLTDAPGVTGGEVMLIWSVVFTGRDPSGIVAGGSVYIEAYSGDILQYLVPG